MVSPTRRVYWDSCAWIALIQQEKIGTEDRGALTRGLIDLAKKGLIEIVTSTFTLTEVCKARELRETITEDKIADFLENDYILLVQVDRIIAADARKLMFSGHSGLKPADATHLATAAFANVDEMHTFDDDLLKLSGRIQRKDGTMLTIVKPGTPSDDEMPLFKAAP